MGTPPFKNSHVTLLPTETHFCEQGEGKGPGLACPLLCLHPPRPVRLSSVPRSANSETLYITAGPLTPPRPRAPATERPSRLCRVVVVVDRKNPEESLLRPTHCLLSFLCSCQQGKRQRQGRLGRFPHTAVGREGGLTDRQTNAPVRTAWRAPRERGWERRGEAAPADRLAGGLWGEASGPGMGAHGVPPHPKMVARPARPSIT